MERPAHLFISDSNGALYDTRAPDWSSSPLRANFSATRAEIKTVADFKATLRAGSHAWPGGYPLYFLTSDGGTLSFEGARNNLQWIYEAIAKQERFSGWQVCACSINWEDTELFCDDTGKPIESAYGESEDAE